MTTLQPNVTKAEIARIKQEINRWGNDINQLMYDQKDISTYSANREKKIGRILRRSFDNFKQLVGMYRRHIILLDSRNLAYFLITILLSQSILQLIMSTIDLTTEDNDTQHGTVLNTIVIIVSTLNILFNITLPFSTVPTCCNKKCGCHCRWCDYSIYIIPILISIIASIISSILYIIEDIVIFKDETSTIIAPAPVPRLKTVDTAMRGVSIGSSTVMFVISVISVLIFIGYIKRCKAIYEFERNRIANRNMTDTLTDDGDQ